MSNKDWTDKLPDLLDGYTEAEPEGLWDAVRAGIVPQKRRVIAAWWYAGGALLAAAAVSAVFFLWPSRQPAIPAVTVVPGESVIAETLPAVAESPAPVAETPKNAPAENPMEPLEWQKPAETLPEESLVTPEADKPTPPSAKTTEIRDEATQPDPPSAKTAEIRDEATQPDPPSAKTAEIRDEATQPDPPSAKTPEIRDEAVTPTVLERRKTFRPSLKVQIGLSTTGFFGQTAMNTTTGVGLPDNPGIRPNALPNTKAAAPGGTNQSAIPMMMSRNKASTTDAVHAQSARLALGVTVGITEHWGVETGIIGSTLTSQFNTEAGNSIGYLTRTMKYCGIPLYVRYNVLQKGRLGLYLNAGPMYEFCTDTNTDNSTYIGTKRTGHTVDNTRIEDSQWSLNAGGGAQLRVFNHGALYVLPGVSYHLPLNSAVENFYTEHPLSFSVTFGYNFLF